MAFREAKQNHVIKCQPDSQKKRQYQSCCHCQKNYYIQIFRGNKVTEWGIQQEETSREKYKELKLTTSADYSVVQCGLVVCVKHPWLAASPDGLVYDLTSNPPEGLVEFKNPNTARDKTLVQAASSKTFCLQLS